MIASVVKIRRVKKERGSNSLLQLMSKTKIAISIKLKMYGTLLPSLISGMISKKEKTD